MFANCPLAHCWQEEWSLEVKYPVGHNMHVDDDVAPLKVLYIRRPHKVQLEEPELIPNCPWVQELQETDPVDA